MPHLLISILTLSLWSVPLCAQTNGGYGDSLPPTCTAGSIFVTTNTPALSICGPANTWNAVGGGEGSLPSGAIMLIASGTCPAGFTESSELNGKMLRGTVAVNGDVGTTGGADSITPTVASLTAAAQVFTGTPFTAIINHTHPVTDPGHSHTQASTTISTGSTSNRLGTADTSSTAQNTGSATTGITTENPVGGVSSITPAGTNGTSAVTGTLNSFDNRPSYLNVIFCVKS